MDASTYIALNQSGKQIEVGQEIFFNLGNSASEILGESTFIDQNLTLSPHQFTYNDGNEIPAVYWQLR